MNKVRARSQGSTRAADGDHVMFALLRAAETLESQLEQSLGEIGLSLAKFGALTHLVEAGDPLSLSECATKMTCVRSNITQLMDRLEADGLVRRVEDPADRRGVRAAVTPLGVERQAAGARNVARLQSEFSKRLSGIDRGALERVLSTFK